MCLVDCLSGLSGQYGARLLSPCEFGRGDSPMKFQGAPEFLLDALVARAGFRVERRRHRGFLRGPYLRGVVRPISCFARLVWAGAAPFFRRLQAELFGGAKAPWALPGLVLFPLCC